MIWSIIALIVWILFMVINARVARRKNRSVVGWVVAAFFFSWISTVILLILPSKSYT